ncbi:MAG: hypothetical protein AAF351_01245 [Pseudomonadota bacterium]
MKKLFISILSLMIAAPVALAHDHGSSFDDWYKNDYALTYATPDASRATDWSNYFAEVVTTYNADGSTEEGAGATWIGDAIDYWVSEGWMGSKLVGYQSDALNDGTVMVKAKWHDTYEGGEEATECGWYLASKTDDGWRISGYAGIDCDAHGL